MIQYMMSYLVGCAKQALLHTDAPHLLQMMRKVLLN